MKSVIRVSKFVAAGGEVKSDKNGKNPFYLNYISGDRLPKNARVLSGTIAENLDIEEGKNYAIQVEESKMDEQYGQQYSHQVLGEVTTTELLTAFGKDLFKQVKETVEANAPVGAGV